MLNILTVMVYLESPPERRMLGIMKLDGHRNKSTDHSDCNDLCFCGDVENLDYVRSGQDQDRAGKPCGNIGQGDQLAGILIGLLLLIGAQAMTDDRDRCQADGIAWNVDHGT